MEAPDIVIHKGEKDERYQLYVEDYVMSYLKNYRTTDRKQIFFYGERKPKEKKYRIYGAGRQKQIPYFAKYELLDEIACHYVMDMPVFSIKEGPGVYELAGYYIFYQSNDAMQGYMIEQRKNAEAGEKEESRSKAYTKSSHQSRASKAADIAGSQTKDSGRGGKRQPAWMLLRGKNQEKPGNGVMAVQLSAIFVIMAAIVINSTNSYGKLKELGQAAVEVFFVLENKEAVEDGESAGGADGTADEKVLKLADLDKKFEEENHTAKLEEEDIEDKPGSETPQSGSGKESGAADDAKETAAAEGISSSEQAFSRNITEYYRIEKGDTLYKISIKIYGDSSKVAEICELNQITNPDHIEYGQKILLP